MNYSMNLKSKEKTEKEIIDFKTLQDLISTEFIDSCERILIDNQSKFIEDYFFKITLIIRNIYGNDIFTKIKSLDKILNKNKIDFINNVYSPMYKLCSFGLEQYNLNNTINGENFKIHYLNNYRPHCMNSGSNKNLKINTTGIHICSGKFIIITEDASNINIKNNSYIICTKCKKCYFPSSIPMLCCYCYSFYYSEIIPENIKSKNCYLATWSKYHCKNINNEKMSCIKCGEDFWLKNNMLFCKNCKFEIAPIDIIWTCLICNSDFNSDAKIYNPLEFKEAQLIIKEALIYKKIVKPSELPCKCISNDYQIDKINFNHKIKNQNNEECKGLLFFSEINEKKYIVCSLCLNIYSINKFNWICPICCESFKTMKIKIFKRVNLKEKNNIQSNNLNKNIFAKDNIKNQSYKNSSRKNQRIVTLLDKDNSEINSNNKTINKKVEKKNNLGDQYLSPNRKEIINFNIRNVKSYIKTQSKDMHRVSCCYSSSSKDLVVSNNSQRINNSNISNNPRNNVINKKYQKIKKNNTINNGCLYSLNIKKRRNFSEIPNDIKGDKYFQILKQNINENKNNNGTCSTIFSSLSYYNINSQKEAIVKPNLEQNSFRKYKIILNNEDNNIPKGNKIIINNFNNNSNEHRNKKSIINNNNDEKKFFSNKADNKRNNFLSNSININNNNFNEYIQSKIKNKIINNENIQNQNNNIININSINTINNEYNIKIINNNSKSPKFFKKKDNFKNIDFFEDINNENILKKKMNKKQKGHKSFYLKDNKYILINLENENINNKEINKNDNNRRNTNFIAKNIFKINDSQLDLKQRIPHNDLNNSKNFKKNRKVFNRKEDQSICYFTNNQTPKYNKKHNINNSYFNNLTINNNSNFYLHNNNSISNDCKLKKKKNDSFEKIGKPMMKNININIECPKLNNNIYNYNLSFTKELKNVFLNKRNNNISMNSKLSSKENISNNQINISNYNTNNNKLKQFNFDDYTIITQLGQGSFGKIYLVKDSKGNIYSMKKLLLSEELDVKNVINEYNMCYNLSHPNIIKILGVYSNKLDKTTFVVYVLMEVGISDWEKEITSYKTKKMKYSESELINILKQLISSLSFLQKNNISHRDIKPQNILIFKNKVYKLTDFGEARRIREKDNNNNSLAQYSLKGTELYMSPLLFNGLRTGQIDIKHNTYKSDVYSLGLCLLYAATANDKSLFEVRRIIEMDKIRRYVSLALKDKYSEKLIDIIVSMLEIHEQKRPDFIELEEIIKNF